MNRKTCSMFKVFVGSKCSICPQRNVLQEFILHAQLWIFVHSPIVGLAFKYFLFFMDCEFFHLISFDAIEGNCAGQETLFILVYLKYAYSS